MSLLNLNFSVDVNDQELDLLKKILKTTDFGKLEKQIENYAKASIQEYIKLFVGQKVFNRGSDFKEYRLFLIIQNALDNEIPDEEFVSALFQLTQSESKSLIRSVMSKYQYDLNRAIHISLEKIIREAQPNETEKGSLIEYTVDIKNEGLLKELNRIVGNISGSAISVAKKSGTYSTYIIKPSTYEILAGFFHIKQEV